MRGRTAGRCGAGAWLLVLGCGVASSAGAAAPLDDVTPHAAIVSAVARALVVEAAISVSSLSTPVAGEPGLTAEPEATARFGKPSHFVLSANGVRRGRARATVTARARVARAARPIARGEAIADHAVEFVEAELQALPIGPLPAEGDLIGRTARRPIAQGELLTAPALRLPHLVRSGDEVEVIVRIGHVRVSGVGKASGSGWIGDTIGVLQPHRSRPLRARITGPARVEIVE